MMDREVLVLPFHNPCALATDTEAVPLPPPPPRAVKTSIHDMANALIMKSVLVFIVVPCHHLECVDGTFNKDENDFAEEGHRYSVAIPDHLSSCQPFHPGLDSILNSWVAVQT
jgi:hypothetical protein